MTVLGSDAASDVVRTNADRHPDALALEDADTGEQWTWVQLEDRVARLAGALSERAGVSRGDCVVVVSEGSTRNFEIQFALMRLGAVLVPLNWRLAEPELITLARDVNPDLVIFDEVWRDTATRIAREVGASHLMGWECPGVELDYETELAKAEPVPAGTLNRLSDPTHVLHTSGTTGVPKGALVTLQTITWNTLNVMHDSALTGPGTKQLNPLPLFHAGGLTTYANPILLTGGAQSVMRRFDPVAVARLLTDPSKGITHWIAPPVMHQAVGATREFQEGELSSLVFALVAGGVPPQALVDQWLAKGVALQQSYGGTELGPAVTLLTRDQVATRSQSCGRAVPFTHVRLVTPDGVEARPGEVGEIWIKGPSVTPGYWKVAEGDSDGFDDGWFRTGDAARQDDEGYYYLVDRFKDMYKSGGENVYPAEVERLLITHPAVAEIAILGVPDERWGQVGHAFVVPTPGASVTLGDLVEHCAGSIARYKAPKVLSLLDALPRNTTGKVQKQLLRAELGVSGIG